MDLHGDRQAVQTAEASLSRSAVDERSSRRADALHVLGRQPGDRVLVDLPNGAEYATVASGAIEAGTPKQ